MSYRGIENWYGNLYQFVDGINIQNNIPFVADHSYISDQFTSPYSSLGLTLWQSTGYPTNIAVSNSFNYQFLPLTIGGSTSTYLTDYYYQASGNRITLYGGSWSYGGYAGGFFWYCSPGSSYVDRFIGGRLLWY